jgi:hypothetical protein
MRSPWADGWQYRHTLTVSLDGIPACCVISQIFPISERFTPHRDLAHWEFSGSLIGIINTLPLTLYKKIINTFFAKLSRRCIRFGNPLLTTTEFILANCLTGLDRVWSKLVKSTHYRPIPYSTIHMELFSLCNRQHPSCNASFSIPSTHGKFRKFSNCTLGIWYELTMTLAKCTFQLHPTDQIYATWTSHALTQLRWSADQLPQNGLSSITRSGCSKQLHKLSTDSTVFFCDMWWYLSTLAETKVANSVTICACSRCTGRCLRSRVPAHDEMGHEWQGGLERNLCTYFHTLSWCTSTSHV